MRISNRLRVGRGGNTGTLTITGGTLSVPNTFSTFGDTGTAIVSVSGGTLNVDRLTVGQQIGDTASVDLTGGTVNISPTDASPSSVSGALVLGDGTMTIDISGSATLNVEALIMGINETPLTGGLGGFGVITIDDGGTLNLTGSTIASPLPIISFESIPLAGSDWLGGSIAMEGGLWTLAGDQVSFINGAIGDGYVTHTSVGGSSLLPVYSAGTDTTTVTIVPEPSTCLLAGLAGLAMVGFRRRQK
ncbi:MAG: PEP-CTERM sorting domain-containing protein [Planctomycetes bacterium]|nr:PEP-CTERM sorting domain-containing protein [Planctomycetota bacterium]